MLIEFALDDARFTDEPSQLAASARWRRGKPFGGSLRLLAGQRLAELGRGQDLEGVEYHDSDSGDDTIELYRHGILIRIFFLNSDFELCQVEAHEESTPAASSGGSRTGLWSRHSLRFAAFWH